jgi:hypothetical protein
MRYACSVLVAMLSLACGSTALAGKTRNVVLIISDGLRPEEMFRGAELELINKSDVGGWYSADELRKRFYDPDPTKSRKLLFPFIWGTIATEGQLFGNAELGSQAQVTNGYDFSYPGYNEMSTGVPDPRINTNEYGPNPNVTVFEWLAGRPELKDKVNIFGSWETFHDIFNDKRSHLPVRSGGNTMDADDKSSRGQLLRSLYDTTTRLEGTDPADSFVNVAVEDFLQNHRPRVMFIGFGETDGWAHSGRYDLVLESAHNFDSFVAGLWHRMQSMPEYKDQTTFILSADHGRGHGMVDWKDHGVDQKGSNNIWIAVIGPDTPALGERHNVARVTQSQIAATIASLLGEDYGAAVPKAAKPLTDAMKKP